MSAESLAAFRKSVGDDLANLAEKHLEHDLEPSDRDVLQSAARSLSTHALIGSLAGIALGGFLAWRIRTNRASFYRAFRATERPTHVRFADGREEAIPDITPLLKPSTVGDIATYTFFAAGGLFFGGELGMITGSMVASRKVRKDPQVKDRIEKAWQAFRVDVLKKQIDELERGEGGLKF